jgi:hypothetical protein
LFDGYGLVLSFGCFKEEVSAFQSLVQKLFSFLSLEMAAKIVLKDVQEASKRIGPYIHRTPIMTCSTLDKMSGKSLFFKCEIFQKVGAFKVSVVLVHVAEM